MEDIIIEFKISKEQAIKIAKKTIASKIALQKDNGDYLEFGTKPVLVNPGMLVTVKVNDNHYALNKKGMGGQLLDQAVFMLKEALEEAEEEKPTNASSTNSATPNNAKSNITVSPEQYLSYQEKVVELLKQFKDLLANGIITEEEFSAKKEELLNFIQGMAK